MNNATDPAYNYFNQSLKKLLVEDSRLSIKKLVSLYSVALPFLVLFMVHV